MVRVLIADDSAFMRNALKNMLSSDPEIIIAGVARDGVEAVEKAMELKPDIITLDVDMPRMDGLEALRLIMEKNPVPVIMVSSLTTEGARETFRALELGAVDFIPKNLSDMALNIVKIKPILIEKVKMIAKKGIVRRKMTLARPVTQPSVSRGSDKAAARRVSIVTIGASTGGPRALEEILTALPEGFPVPIVIAQHMPDSFTALFAERLDQMSRLRVKEARDGEELLPGAAYIAPGRGHIEVNKQGISARVLIRENGELIYRPSVDHLLVSASEAFPGRTLGVILTGMGSDGLKGAMAVKQSGGRVYVQDEETSAVYGMPRAVAEAGLADKVLPIEMIAGEIMNVV